MLRTSDLTYNVYEVIDQSTHRYSSTSVSGGGVDSISGRIQEVSSSVTHHSDQEIWLQDLDGGRQRKLDISSFNIDVRPGHRVIMVWDKATGRLERILNVDTQIKNHCNGIYNDWDHKHAYLRKPVMRFANAILTAFMSLLPVFGWFFMTIQSLISLVGGRPMGDGHYKHPGNRLATTVVIACVLAHAMISYYSLYSLLGSSTHPFDYYSGYHSGWQQMAGTVMAYFTLPGELLYRYSVDGWNLFGGAPVAEIINAALQSGGRIDPLAYWLHHSAMLAVYVLVTVFLVNLWMGRQMVRNEGVVTELTRQVGSEHPALK